MIRLFHSFALILITLATSDAQQTATSYRLSSATNKLKWAADYVIGKGHEGTLQISSGVLYVQNGQITRGDFQIDMTSIRNTDIKDERSRKDLEEHLRSEDFFSVVRFPVCTLSVTSTKENGPGNYTVNGYLIIAGFINPISFPAVIEVGSTIKVKASFPINRTKWGIVYQSKSIFDSIKDGAISDLINISLELEFLKEN